MKDIIKVDFFRYVLNLFPATEEKPPSATLVFLFLEHGVYDWKSLNEFVIWFEVLESMIHGAEKKIDELDIKQLNKALDLISV